MTITPVQLRMARAALGMSVDDLASAAGVGSATIFRIEHQVGRRPRPSTFERLRDTLEGQGIRFGDADHQVCLVERRVCFTSALKQLRQVCAGAPGAMPTGGK